MDGEQGTERSAAMYSLIVTAKLNGIDPQARLLNVLARIAEAWRPFSRRPRVGRREGGLDVPGRRGGKCRARPAGASMGLGPAIVSTRSPHRAGRGPGVSAAGRRPRCASSGRRWPTRRRGRGRVGR